MFVHLNIHSVFSYMRGLIPLDNLMKLVSHNNMDTLALTDVNGMGGFIKLFGIKSTISLLNDVLEEKLIIKVEK